MLFQRTDSETSSQTLRNYRQTIWPEFPQIHPEGLRPEWKDILRYTQASLCIWWGYGHTSSNVETHREIIRDGTSSYLYMNDGSPLSMGWRICLDCACYVSQNFQVKWVLYFYSNLISVSALANNFTYFIFHLTCYLSPLALQGGLQMWHLVPHPPLVSLWEKQLRQILTASTSTCPIICKDILVNWMPKDSLDLTFLDITRTAFSIHKWDGARKKLQL